MELNLSLNALLSALSLSAFGVFLLPLPKGIVIRWVAWVSLWSISTPTTHGADASLETLVIVTLFGIAEILFSVVSVRKS